MRWRTTGSDNAFLKLYYEHRMAGTVTEVEENHYQGLGYKYVDDEDTIDCDSRDSWYYHYDCTENWYYVVIN